MFVKALLTGPAETVVGILGLKQFMAIGLKSCVSRLVAYPAQRWLPSAQASSRLTGKRSTARYRADDVDQPLPRRTKPGSLRSPAIAATDKAAVPEPSGAVVTMRRVKSGKKRVAFSLSLVWRKRIPQSAPRKAEDQAYLRRSRSSSVGTLYCQVRRNPFLGMTVTGVRTCCASFESRLTTWCSPSRFCEKIPPSTAEVSRSVTRPYHRQRQARRHSFLRRLCVRRICRRGSKDARIPQMPRARSSSRGLIISNERAVREAHGCSCDRGSRHQRLRFTAACSFLFLPQRDQARIDLDIANSCLRANLLEEHCGIPLQDASSTHDRVHESVRRVTS